MTFTGRIILCKIEASIALVEVCARPVLLPNKNGHEMAT
jgi:hypothetical protein